ncbi:MAG: DUF1919 domain-containing protein [Clostridia bacterium]|nr:DUF1919 domain-containing protein [Clostridia bacterium]
MGKSILARAEHKLYITLKRRRLKNKTPSIIANTCIGGIICHDMGIPFNSPCINSGMIAKDYIKFLQNMDHYLAVTPTPLDTYYGEKQFMMTQMDDLIGLFAHEESVDVAIAKWEKRKSRINKDNLFIIMTETLECTYDDIKAFDELPYPNKVILVHKPYEEIKSAFYLKGFEDMDEVGVTVDWKPTFLKRRYIDDFDYVSFFNGDGIKKG